MEIMTRSRCQEIDKYTIEEIGIPSLVLMENAAKEVTDKVINLGEKFAIFCGSGNNGGDGLVIARKLILQNKDVCVVIVSKSDKYSKDFLVNFNILKKLTNNIICIKGTKDIFLLDRIVNNYEIAVDCIFGIGLNRVLEDFYIELINLINEKFKFVISIDVPSGLNADDGSLMGACIIANITYTFEVIKKGFIEYKALDYLGRVEVLKIGIPDFVKKIKSQQMYILDKEDYKKLLKKRRVYGHKGSYGKVSILAGGKGYTGAAYIATEACVKAGAGLTTLVSTKYVQDKLSSKLIEAMTANIEEGDDLKNIFNNSRVFAIGPGIDKEKIYKEILLDLVNYENKQFVIDAGAFKILKENREIMNRLKGRSIFTPHPGEMAVLIDKTLDYVEENRINVAKKYAKENDIIVLLKGYNTIVTDGECVYINRTGNSKMASGGMGDCLTGIIAALLAQGHSLLVSALVGAYVHGIAGEIASEGKYSTVASELIENISKAMNYI
ncbi:bifunctional ADP-dependent NAD(P)H-hydrate dehydratase/NAD(P)H-hydrate epimerase [Clostridium nigeriense]|uniref:bifunctional ADP-dependent NAD(P)H-hydrate dehydratase/NAD(P)H-hydrate epimerase n=1 Tax=Clostridium nigeriense TaxID=1805470 RepID=UPI00083555F4|nr:bifunctional ADP-dependent NAD(P)H-hydrate dehydratase/NAD(P)H-hydrate epimerase [Clostridium nigeriense]